MKAHASLKSFVSAGAIAIGLTSASAAHAQQAVDESQAAAPANEQSDAAIVVTGSRIALPQYSQPNPIVVTDAATIEQSGKTNLADVLVETPSLLGSQTAVNSSGSNLNNAQEVGSNFLSLRNLGRDRTLVLVDGRRHIAGVPGSAAVDINTIPTDLVERVDILTGGVSAVYGADGVSGVVNFIMKDNFDGLRIRGQAGISTYGDAGNRFIAATFGKNFADDRANVTLAYEYNVQDRFPQTNRLNRGLTGPTYRFVRNPNDPNDDPNIPDFVPLRDLRWADSSPGGAVDLDFDYASDFTGEGGVYDRGIIVGSTTIGGSGTPTQSYFGDNLPYLERHIGNVLAKFEVSPALEFYVQGKYAHSNGLTFAQPSYDFFTLLAPDNAYLAQRFGPNAAPNCTTDGVGADVCGAWISRDNLDFGIRNYSLKRDLWRTVLGVRGDLSPNLRYDVSYVYGQTKQVGTNYNDRIADRYYAALDAVVDPSNGQITCRINLPGQTTINSFTYTGSSIFGPAGLVNTLAPISFQKGQCVPLNILGSGSPSQAALDFVTADHSDAAKLTQHVVTASISGDTGNFFNLPGGPIGFAVGAEYRKESSRYVPSDLSLAGLLIDNAPAKIDQGSFDVKELFAELSVPVLTDRPFFYDLRFGGAVRLSDYSTVGKTTTWKVDANWAPVRDIAFRGTYSRAVRAPNIGELFAGGSGTYEFIIDPCGIDRLGEGTATRAANCAQALNALGFDPTTFDPGGDAISPENSSLLGFVGGNPDLDAEAAKTWTAGVVLRPSFLRNFYFSADWYDIRIKNAIQYSTAEDLVNLCYDQPTLQNQYCSLIERSAVNGYISNFNVVPQNVASFRTSGLDVALNYKFTISPSLGTLSLRAVGNYLDKLSFVPSLGAAPVDEVLDFVTYGQNDYPAPRYSGNLDLTWETGPFTLNYGVNYFSKTRRASAEQIAGNPDYYAPEYLFYKEHWEHDLYASVNVDDRFEFYVGVNNLLNTKPDVAEISFPADPTGRFFYAGFKAKVF